MESEKANWVMPIAPTKGQQKYGAHHDPFTLQGRILDLERENEALLQLIEGFQWRLETLEEEIKEINRRK
jgi:hypothetical protein